MTLPLPPHSLQLRTGFRMSHQLNKEATYVCCVCANIPGKICCRPTLTPVPPQPLQGLIALSEAAPVPRQWSQRIFFLILNCCAVRSFIEKFVEANSHVDGVALIPKGRITNGERS